MHALFNIVRIELSRVVNYGISPGELWDTFWVNYGMSPVNIKINYKERIIKHQKWLKWITILIIIILSSLSLLMTSSIFLSLSPSLCLFFFLSAVKFMIYFSIFFSFVIIFIIWFSFEALVRAITDFSQSYNKVK